MNRHSAHSQRQQPSPIDIQRALGGVDYPASRSELVETARRHQADESIVGLIERLPDRDYDGPTAVTKEITRL